MPATAHWNYFSMQRALYDKGSAQGKQPEKLNHFATAGRRWAASDFNEKRRERALSKHVAARIMTYRLFPLGATRTCKQRN